MKKVLMILLASMALAACGDGSNRSEASRDQEENYDNTQPSVSPEDETQSDPTMESDSLENNNLNQDNTDMDNTEPGVSDDATGDTLAR